jgi:hypothetical protein
MGMSAVGLNNELRSLGIQYKQSNTYCILNIRTKDLPRLKHILLLIVTAIRKQQ